MVLLDESPPLSVAVMVKGYSPAVPLAEVLQVKVAVILEMV